MVRLLPILLILTFPAAVRGQFTYTTNNGSITITKYTGPGGAVVIPSTLNGLSVTTIGGYTVMFEWTGAFQGCKTLTGATIPNSVTNIGEAAFAECIVLTGITIPNSVSSIGSGAFVSSGLTSVSISSGIIGDDAFANCGSLTSVTIGDGVTSIGGAAFQSCGSLISVTIGSGVTSIGGAAFSYNGSLTNVTIGSGALTGGTFYYCTNLKSVTIGEGVTYINWDAFDGCASLTNIAVVPLNEFYSSVDGVLFDKSQTTLIQYPQGKTGGYTIPNGVISFADYAFEDCPSLTSVTIPNTVTNIGDQPLRFCPSLTNIAVVPLNEFYSSVDGVLFDKSQTTLIQYPVAKAGSYTIPSGVISIGGYAFSGCASLTSLMTPTVTNIGEGAFSLCPSLTNVTITGSSASRPLPSRGAVT